MRLIDADELIEKRFGCDNDCEDCDFAQEQDSWCQGEVFVVNILEAPTVDAEPIRHGKMCIYDEAFTIQEMLEETNQCRNCRLDCPNAGQR